MKLITTYLSLSLEGCLCHENVFPWRAAPSSPLKQTHEHVHPWVHTHRGPCPPAELAPGRPACRPSPAPSRSAPSAWEPLCPVPSPRHHPALQGRSCLGSPSPAPSPPPRPAPHPHFDLPAPHSVHGAAQHRCKQYVKETASGLGL